MKKSLTILAAAGLLLGLLSGCGQDNPGNSYPEECDEKPVIYLDAPAGGLNGLWKLRCYGKKISDGRFNVWLPTMEEVTDRTAFLQPEPDLTVTLPATALFPISVGGFRPETETVSPFSGRGDICSWHVYNVAVA